MKLKYAVPMFAGLCCLWVAAIFYLWKLVVVLVGAAALVYTAVLSYELILTVAKHTKESLTRLKGKFDRTAARSRNS